MNIALCTYHRAQNGGAQLQAWALKTVLERMGHTVGFAANAVGVERRWAFPWTTPGGCVRNVCSLGWEDLSRHRFHAFSARHFKPLAARPDLAVVGSDQVWNLRIAKDDAPLFLGERLDCPHVAYAASVGDRPPTADEAARLRRAAAAFKAVSVREPCFLDAPVVCDPTLLLTAADYEPILTPPPLREPYLFAYAVSMSDAVVAEARRLAREKGLRLVLDGVYCRTKFRAPREHRFGLSPDRLLGYVRHAAIVVASSFHGVALARLYDRPCVALEAGTRVRTLLASGPLEPQREKGLRFLREALA